MVEVRAAAFEIELRLREAPARGRHFGAPVPALQFPDPVQRLGIGKTLATKFRPRLRDVHRQKALALRHVLPDPDVYGRNDSPYRAQDVHRPPGRERALQRDAVGNRPGIDGHLPHGLRGTGIRFHGGSPALEQVERPPGPKAGTEEQPDRQHRAQPLPDPYLAKRRRQRIVALLDLPIGVLQAVMLLLYRPRHSQFGLPELAQFGDVAEHRDHRHYFGAVVTLPPEIGCSDRERARAAAHFDLDHAPFHDRVLRRRVEQQLRKVVEALALDEQFRETPVSRLACPQRQYALRRRIERLDPTAPADDQHPVLEVVEHLTMAVRPRHRPTRSMAMPHRSSVMPSVLSSPISEFR